MPVVIRDVFLPHLRPLCFIHTHIARCAAAIRTVKAPAPTTVSYLALDTLAPQLCTGAPTRSSSSALSSSAQCSAHVAGTLISHKCSTVAPNHAQGSRSRQSSSQRHPAASKENGWQITKGITNILSICKYTVAVISQCTYYLHCLSEYNFIANLNHTHLPRGRSEIKLRANISHKRKIVKYEDNFYMARKKMKMENYRKRKKKKQLSADCTLSVFVSCSVKFSEKFVAIVPVLSIL